MIYLTLKSWWFLKKKNQNNFRHFFFHKKNVLKILGEKIDIFFCVRSVWATDASGLNPPTQLVIGYHWLAFLNQVRKNLSEFFKNLDTNSTISQKIKSEKCFFIGSIQTTNSISLWYLIYILCIFTVDFFFNIRPKGGGDRPLCPPLGYAPDLKKIAFMMKISL